MSNADEVLKLFSGSNNFPSLIKLSFIKLIENTGVHQHFEIKYIC